jgi:mannan endo-1,4-beta-mannosidase
LYIYSWGKYDPKNKNSLNEAQEYAKEYLTSRAEWSRKIKKPIILEEFGMARDAWRKPTDSAYKYDVNTPTSHKDIYYEGLYRHIEHLSYGGSNFWAYGGLGRPNDEANSYGMTWLGGKLTKCTMASFISYSYYILCIDPPHEPKGWYSVYNQDITTINVIKTHFSNTTIVTL